MHSEYEAVSTTGNAISKLLVQQGRDMEYRSTLSKHWLNSSLFSRGVIPNESNEQGFERNIIASHVEGVG